MTIDCQEGPHFPLDAAPLTPDPRDYSIEDHYALTATPKPVKLPAVIRVQHQPPILNQGAKPWCTTYSTERALQQEELAAGRPVADFDEAWMFSAVHGTPAGASLRDVLTVCINHGYPVAGTAGAAAPTHRLRAYYAVPISVEAIKSALLSFGELVLAMSWGHSQFHPRPNGVLPPLDSIAGYHAIAVGGANDAVGIQLDNSWGSKFGVKGRCYLPYSQLGQVQAVFKLVHA